jgi:hypothetical protein
VPWTAADDLANAADALDGDRAFWLSANAVSNAKAHVDQLVAASFAETLTLTPAPDDLTGTSADDVFNGAVEQTAFLPIQTLNTDDSLDGGGGRNTLNAQLVDPFVVPEKLANIQVVNINQPSGLTPVIVGLLVPVTLDVVNANAIDTVNFRAPVQDITIASLTTALSEVSITDNTFPALPGRVFTISHVGSATNGDDDELDIALRNDNVDTTLNLDFQPGGGYEIVNIESTGPLQNRFELNASPREIFIDGDADLRIRGDAMDLATLRVFNSEDLEEPAGVDARFHGNGGGLTTDIDTGNGADRLVFVSGTSAVLNINTNGGDDFVDLWDHTGNVTANLGDGADYFEVDGTGNMNVVMSEGDNEAVFGDVVGNVAVTAGAGSDDFFFENILAGGPGSGNVNANAGNGDNYLFFHEVEGIINAVAGTGNDEFDFDDVWQGGGVGRHTFGGEDLIDGGAGLNRVDFEVESHAGGGDEQLLTGGTIVNIQTAGHHGEFAAGNDLLVNFALLGSVTRLELQGEYADDVRITNLNNTDGGIDMVAIQSDIADDLVLSRAFVTIPAFHLEIGNDHDPFGVISPSVTVGQLIAGTGTDLFTITSVGGGTNEFSDVRLVDGNVSLQGSTNLHFGSNVESAAYDENNGQIDASLLSGNDEIWVDDGHQTVQDGAGNDFIGTWDNDSSSDLILLAAGANTVRFHAFNDDFDAGGIGSVPRELHEVDGFNSGSGAEADLLQVSLNSDGIGDIEDTDNDPVLAGDFANIRDVQVGDVINLQDSSINFLKFTTAGTAGNVEDLFDLVIGAGVIDVANGTEWVLASAYDSAFANADGSVGAMVVFAIDGGNQITSGDDCAGLTTVGMSYTDYLAFESSNFQFVA